MAEVAAACVSCQWQQRQLSELPVSAVGQQQRRRPSGATLLLLLLLLSVTACAVMFQSLGNGRLSFCQLLSALQLVQLSCPLAAAQCPGVCQFRQRGQAGPVMYVVLHRAPKPQMLAVRCLGDRHTGVCCVSRTWAVCCLGLSGGVCLAQAVCVLCVGGLCSRVPTTGGGVRAGGVHDGAVVATVVDA